MTKRFSPLVVSANAVTGFESLRFGTIGGTAWAQQTLVYGAAIAFALDSGLHGIVTITDNVAFVVSAPTIGGVAVSAVAPFTSMTGLACRITFRNASGGAHGAGTFNAIFKASALPAIANGFSRTIDFEFNGANFIETNVSSRDVPN